ncbi:hypothetical protein K439DRAFT_1614531 [Ramaria rubella]|nr:hypothetical protein K439DRAFT_1614531 [Ramaria rubella]
MDPSSSVSLACGQHKTLATRGTFTVSWSDLHPSAAHTALTGGTRVVRSASGLGVWAAYRNMEKCEISGSAHGHRDVPKARTLPNIILRPRMFDGWWVNHRAVDGVIRVGGGEPAGSFKIVAFHKLKQRRRARPSGRSQSPTVAGYHIGGGASLPVARKSGTDFGSKTIRSKRTASNSRVEAMDQCQFSLCAESGCVSNGDLGFQHSGAAFGQRTYGTPEQVAGSNLT